MKKNVSMVLVSAIILSLCACGNTASGGVTSTDGTGAPASETTTTPASENIVASETSSTTESREQAGPTQKPVELESAEFPFYYRDVNDMRSITLYFADKDHEIPYLDSETVRELLENIYHDVDHDSGFKLSVETDGHSATFTRENGYMMVIDCDTDTIRFPDYDAFFMPSYSPTVIDVLEHYGLIPCLKQNEKLSYSRYGSEVCFELESYGIDLIEKDGDCYIPMQTFSDIATSLSSYVFFLYNGNCVFADEFASSYQDELMEKYRETGVKDTKRSKTLAEFTYNELCMTMDYCYGLKNQHNITSFDEYFFETGLKKDLLDEDIVVSSKAMSELIFLYLSDGHCSYNGNSYRIDKDTEVFDQIGNSLLRYISFIMEFSSARSEYYPDGVPGYEEIGNTAYITFDSFDTMPADVDYYNDPPTAETTDAVGICLYAFSQITRENSPIENVVLDLSANGGGDSTTASFVLSMFLGNASICVENTLSGAYMNESFCCDANLDGNFDEKDSLGKYRLFCLTSPCSFSCGNLVPSVLKNSEMVRIIGMSSGGGACVVMPISTADGTMIQISSFRRLSYMKNGSVYDIDQGVSPDYPITTIKRFFDREALTKYINGLY